MREGGFGQTALNESVYFPKLRYGWGRKDKREGTKLHQAVKMLKAWKEK